MAVMVVSTRFVKLGTDRCNLTRQGYDNVFREFVHVDLIIRFRNFATFSVLGWVDGDISFSHRSVMLDQLLVGEVRSISFGIFDFFRFEFSVGFNGRFIILDMFSFN